MHAPSLQSDMNKKNGAASTSPTISCGALVVLHSQQSPHLQHNETNQPYTREIYIACSSLYEEDWKVVTNQLRLVTYPSVYNSPAYKKTQRNHNNNDHGSSRIRIFDPP